MDPISVENHASVHDWIARKGLCLDDHASFDWLSIEPPSSNKMLLRSSTDEVEELAGGKWAYFFLVVQLQSPLLHAYCIFLLLM